MAKTIPFKGYRYNLNKIGDWSKILVPPYDVISPGARKQFQESNPYNMIHLTLATPQNESDTYGHVNQKLHHWMKDDILLPDNQASVYYYTLEFETDPDYLIESKPGRIKRILSGFMALVRLEDFDSKVILPHEITFSKPREDRLKLLESCHAHLEPVYAVYEDNSQKINHAFQRIIGHTQPNVEFTDTNKTVHRFWKINHPQLIHLIETEMQNKSLLIADGHHRYEAALAFRDKLRKKTPSFSNDHPANYMMMYLVNMDDPNLVISPTHRLIRNVRNMTIPAVHKKLEENFVLTSVKDQPDLIVKLSPQKGICFGLYDGKYHLLEFKKKPATHDELLDTDIFQEWVVDKTLAIPQQESMHEHIGFTHSLNESVAKVNSGEYQFAFILRPPDIHDVKRICEQGRRLPQKTTYFYPKPLSGFVIYVFNPI